VGSSRAESLAGAKICMSTILYIHQYFKTPEDGGALRSYFIAKGLVERGHHVIMLTSHNQRTFVKKVHEGIEVHYLPVAYSNYMSFYRRYLSFISFSIACIQQFPKLANIDLVYASSTPLTVGITALWLKWRHGLPFVFEVRDLWPKAPVQLGIMKNFMLIKLSRILENSIYKHAKTIIALSPGVKQDIEENHGISGVILAPNMSDVQFFSSILQCKADKEEMVIGYFGAFGLSNHIEFLVEIADACQQKSLPVRFVFAGDGAKKSMLDKLMGENKLNNVELLGAVSRDELARLMGRTDACITSFADFPVLETNSPNKFFDALAAGRLCIVNTKGWLRQLVEENSCGFYLHPDHARDFPAKISPFIEDKQLLRSYQANARSLGMKSFSREDIVDTICRAIEAEVLFST
jgi:glycosyltransferase involved in cell wall biosynthesis